MAGSAMGSNGGTPVATENIYKLSRRIKRTEQTVYNALRSIYEDALFVREIRDLWRELPLLANLRCGLWYAPEFDGTCYFKSTDGHNGNWSFSPIRLNLHVAKLADPPEFAFRLVCNDLCEHTGIYLDGACLHLGLVKLLVLILLCTAKLPTLGVDRFSSIAYIM